MQKARKPNRPIIGLDLDGVTLNTFSCVLRTVNCANKTEVPYCNLRHYPLFPSLPGSSAEQISNAFNLFWEERPTEIGLIHPKIPTILRQLSEHYEIHITTSAAKGSKKATPNIISTLNRHQIPYSMLHHVESGEAKAALGKSLGIGIYIEDDVKICSSSDAHVILYPQPWVWGHIERHGIDSIGKKVQIRPKPEELDKMNGKPRINGPRLIIIPRNWGDIRTLLLGSNTLRS